jgi:hypothetical protein
MRLRSLAIWTELPCQWIKWYDHLKSGIQNPNGPQCYVVRIFPVFFLLHLNLVHSAATFVEL